MNMNVTVDEIIEICPYITNSIVEELNKFEDHNIKKSIKTWDKYCNIIDSGDLYNCGDNIQNLNDQLEEMSVRTCKNRNYLEKMEQNMEELEKSRNDLLKTIAENEKWARKIKTNISNITKKKENLLQTRDKIQICKLLTNTSFAFKADTVQGYVTSQVSENLHPFEFNTKKYSNSDITTGLYELLKKASTETKETES